MCIANQHLNQLTETHKMIRSDRDILSNRQSELDQLISAIYHEIEVANFNAAEGFYFCKKLQEALQERRIIKNELGNMNSLIQMLELNKLGNKLNSAKQRLNQHSQKNMEYISNFKVKPEEVINITYADKVVNINIS
jgi:cell division protein ZapA (FtsZ GTPase activity inhibitor)